MPKKSGFTLVELLVVISIISILSAVGLVIYTTVMKQGRDSRRQGDLRSVQSALEQYYADQFTYPQSSTSCAPGTLTFQVSCYLKSATGVVYLNTVPADPVGTSPYKYTPTLCVAGKCSSYCLFAHLDNLTTPDLKGCTPPSAAYNFALTPP